MKVLNLIQGSAEWHEHRATHFNASDAPAMMGASKYKARDQLLHEYATGMTKDVNFKTQKLFDDGHKFEALARPIAEKIIGEELSPIVGEDGKYSASFDGITFDNSIIFEHKTLNNDIRACKFADDLDEMYLIQMEQQLMISGAVKCLFLASKWELDGSNESLNFWYVSDAKRRQRIIDGWNQFEIDLANYVPVEVIEPPKAQSILALPSLAIQIKGEVTLSNLPEFKEAATAYIAQISTTFVTDEDFSNGEAAAKFCKEAEDNIESTKKSAIAQTASIDELMRTLDYIKGQLRDKRLVIEKLVSSEKENRKLAIINSAKEAFANHVVALAIEIKPLTLNINNTDFAGAIKGKKTLSSMQSAVNDELARAKIEADATARDIRTKLAWFNKESLDYKNLFPDLQTIIYKPQEDFELSVLSRIEVQLKLEAERIKLNEQKAIDDQRAKPEVAQKVESIAVNIGNAENQVSENQSSPPIMPCVSEIVICVSEYFGVNPKLAHQWLIDIDFDTPIQAAA
jgi:putative phage-type endonuclease